MSKKLVVIPIEIWKREIDSRMYLALHLLRNGFRVLIGEMNDVHIRKATNSIVFHKDHAVWSDVLFKKWFAKKNEIYAFDEEGLIISNENYYINHRVSSFAIKNLHGIFTWGNTQESMIKKKYPVSPLYKVGSLKLELASRLKGELKDSQRDQETIVKSILVNTRFTYLNGRYSSKESLQHLGILNSETDLKAFEEFLVSEKKIRDEFEKFIKLANDSGCSVTLRPHPLEDKSYYCDVFADMQNVIVDSDSDLYTQMQNHDLLVHDGCTTAIEASAMGVCALGLRPKDLSNPYDSTANLFSKNFTSAESLMNYVLTNPSAFSINENSVELNSLIHGWSNLISADIIIDILNKSNIPTQNMSMSRLDFRMILKNFLRFANRVTFDILRYIPVFSVVLKGLDNIDKKFPQINELVVKEKILRLSNVMIPTSEKNGLDHESIHVKMLSKRAFLLDV